MSSSSGQGDDPTSRGFLPHEPLYYAPSSWLERLQPPPSSSLPTSSSAASADEKAPEPLNETAVPPDPLDAELEHAVYESLRRPRDPAVIAEPPGLLSELDRRIRLIGIAGRLAAAIGASATVALVIVLIGPGSRDDTPQSDGTSVGSVQPTRAAQNHQPPGNEDAKPALCELQTILGPPQSQPTVTRQESETLLRQFLQWREKPMVTGAP